MRTVFVNPTRPKRRRSKKKRNPAGGAKTQTALAAYKKGMNDAMANSYSNPRRRRRRRTTAAAPRRRRTYRRKRRSNAGITPFVSRNPLILQNAHRRRRRSNPKMNLQKLLGDSLYYAGGSALGVGVNTLVLDRIENRWAKNGARIGAAVLAGMVFPARWNKLGAATAGALLYPLWQDVMMMVLPGAGATEADLDLLAADLTESLGELDMDEMDELVDEAYF